MKFADLFEKFLNDIYNISLLIYNNGFKILITYRPLWNISNNAFKNYFI